MSVGKTKKKSYHLSTVAIHFLIKTLIIACLTSVVLADDVKIYTWEGYFAESVIEQFKQETGHTITQAHYDDEGLRDTVISSGRARVYDLIVVDDYSIRLMDKIELFHDLSTALASLKDTLDSRWVNACGSRGIPYSWSMMGIMYRESIAPEPITSWKQLFTPPKAHQGRLVMHFDEIDTVAAALMAAGADPFIEKTSELKLAHKLLVEQKKYLLAVDYNYSYALEHGKDSLMSMALGFSGEENSLNEISGSEDWVFVIPKEGTLLSVDCLVAPISKPITEATKTFLAFINRPDMAAMNAEEIWFATPNLKALALTSEDYRADSSLHASEELINKSRLYSVMSTDSLRLRIRIVNSVQ